MFLNFLTNPLETFQSFTYDFNLINMYTLNNPLFLDNANVLVDNTTIGGLPSFVDANNDFLYTTWLSFYLVPALKYLIPLAIGFFLMFHLLKGFNLVPYTTILWIVISVICTQIGCYLFSVQAFSQTEVVVEFTDNVLTSLNASYAPSRQALVTVFFIKEIVSFASLFIVWWILGNYSFKDTLLFPKTVIENFDEVLYRKNLSLFADTLYLRQNEEVKQFQEFFIKVHGVLLFVLVSNVQGMVPYSSTITSSLLNTFYIALAVFVSIWFTLFKEKGINHFFGLFLPSGCPFHLIFLLNPIEFVSYSFRIISLSVRLFANMMAGHTLLKVIAGFSWSLILLGDYFVILHYVPFIVLILLTFLEIAVGFIQTYIFIVLIYMYLADIFIGH